MARKPNSKSLVGKSVKLAMVPARNQIKRSNPVLHAVGLDKFAYNKAFLPSIEPVGNAKDQDKSLLTLARHAEGRDAFTRNDC